MTSDNRFLSAVPCFLAIAFLGGCGGGSSRSSAPPPPPPDTAAPTLGAIQTPAASSFNRTTTLSVTANDNVGVTEVRFFVDGNQIGSDTTAPFSIDWDTTAETDGDHVLRADAVDAAGNVDQSAELTVTVRNSLQFVFELSGRCPPSSRAERRRRT